jgi:hypothetical protein
MAYMMRSAPRLSLFEIALAAMVVLGLCALGCSTAAVTRRVPASIFGGARFRSRPDPAATRTRPRAPARDEGAAFVERELHARGLRFGTDGSTRALWGYLRTSHAVVAPARAQPGDIIFFDTRRRQDEERECADRTGIVRSVDPGGRITFIEARDGGLREAFVHPAFPVARRDDGGRILNSFLRPKKIDDPEGTRYFAGDMLCGVAHTAATAVRRQPG